jgi:tektin-4
VNEVEDLLNRTLVQIQEQLARNKAAKAKLEDDWSDKQETYNLEIKSVSLTNRSDTILFKPAAARFTEK